MMTRFDILKCLTDAATELSSQQTGHSGGKAKNQSIREKEKDEPEQENESKRGSLLQVVQAPTHTAI